MCDRNEVPEGCPDRVRDRADALGVLILGERCRPLCESALLRALSCLCARSPCLLCVQWGCLRRSTKNSQRLSKLSCPPNAVRVCFVCPPARPGDIRLCRCVACGLVCGCTPQPPRVCVWWRLGILHPQCNMNIWNHSATTRDSEDTL